MVSCSYGIPRTTKYLHIHVVIQIVRVGLKAFIKVDIFHNNTFSLFIRFVVAYSVFMFDKIVAGGRAAPTTRNKRMPM